LVTAGGLQESKSVETQEVMKTKRDPIGSLSRKSFLRLSLLFYRGFSGLEADLGVLAIAKRLVR
jgi:hypothetical protein